MYTVQEIRIRSIALALVMTGLLAGCERPEQGMETAGNRAPVDQAERDSRPMGHVMEFDGYTLRANVSRTDVLPEAMARKYGIEPDPNLVLLNLVILENRQDQQPVPVSAEVSAQHQTLSGHVETIEMRAAESDGHVSYIGTMDASGQQMFQIAIDAQPAGASEALQMSFEVQLETFDDGDADPDY